MRTITHHPSFHEKPFFPHSFFLPAFVLAGIIFFSGIAHGELAANSAEKIKTSRGQEQLAARLRSGGTARVIVHLDMPFRPIGKPDSDEMRQQTARIAATQDALLNRLAGRNIKGVHKYQYIPHLFMEVDENGMNALLASPAVLDIQEDVPARPTLDFSVPRIGAPFVWDYAYDGAGVTAAVLDTGVDKYHPFLSGAVVSEACYSSNNPSSSDLATTICPGAVTQSTASGSATPYGGTCPSGKCDHGTHVAGIIAGRQSVSGSPGPGVAPGADLIAIQVFSRFDSPYSCAEIPCVLSYPSDQVKGLERVLALSGTYTISSVNMSLGGDKYSSQSICDGNNSAMKTAIDNLRAAGIATVISAGNDGWCGYMSAPGCISSAISVGATTDADGVAAYSNSASFMSLFAPGSSIMSSVPGADYANYNGTSMAAPHVTGAWALMKDWSPSRTVDQVLSYLTSTGAAITDSKCPSVTKKRINVYDALTKVLNLPRVKATPATGIGQTGATINGVANANNSSPAVLFQYGTTTAYGLSAFASPSVTGATDTAIAATLSGLTPGTLYHYRVRAGIFNGLWWTYTYSDDLTFETAVSGTCGSIQSGDLEGYTPIPGWTEYGNCSVFCNAFDNWDCPFRSGYGAAWFGCFNVPQTTSISQDLVIPGGSPSNLRFYLANTAASSNDSDSFSVSIDGESIFSLIEGDTDFAGYHQVGLDLSPYADGSVHDLTFSSRSTGQTYWALDDISISCGMGALPFVATGPPSSIKESEAVMTGTVNAYGSMTQVKFDIGENPQYTWPSVPYGFFTANGFPEGLALNTPYEVSLKITKLDLGKTYHYRVKAESSAGIAYGRDMTFTTQCSPADVRIGTGSMASIQNAIGASGPGAVIKTTTSTFTEDPVFNRGGLTLTLDGGYDCEFSAKPNTTWIDGKITIQYGAVIIANITIL